VVSLEGRIKLIDFGIAKAATGQPATQVGILKGKFGYMSPEQARGLPVDRRSDVFALGIIFYELLTGLRLFAGEADFAVLERVRRAEIAPPRRANPAIPVEIERIVLKALAREPEQRYAWASELTHDLRSFLGFDASDANAQSMASWIQIVLADELRREEGRIAAFEAIGRPLELPMVSLEGFVSTRRSSTTGGHQTLVLPGGGAAVEFELAKTSLMTSLPREFPSVPSDTDVIDRWDDATRPPLAVSPWPVAPVSPDQVSTRPPSDRARPPVQATASPWSNILWLTLGLLLAGSVGAAGVWAKRSFSSTGALVVTAHPSVGLEVEVDNQALILTKEGMGVIRDLQPGPHFLLAKGPVGRQVRWVTVVANEVVTVDLVFPQSPEPAASPLAHNRE
jgi:serine/threonine protein kinase